MNTLTTVSSISESKGLHVAAKMRYVLSGFDFVGIAKLNVHTSSAQIRPDMPGRPWYVPKGRAIRIAVKEQLGTTSDAFRTTHLIERDIRYGQLPEYDQKDLEQKVASMRAFVAEKNSEIHGDRGVPTAASRLDELREQVGQSE